jgi:hypothetical protein
MLQVGPFPERRPEYGVGLPITFSPNGQLLLVQEPLSLAIVDTYTSQRIPVDGSVAIGSVVRFIAAPGSAHIAALRGDGSVSFYSFGWDQGSLVRQMGTIAADGAMPEVVAGDDGSFLLVTGTEAALYAPVGDTYRRVKGLELPLPDTAAVIRFTR